MFSGEKKKKKKKRRKEEDLRNKNHIFLNSFQTQKWRRINYPELENLFSKKLINFFRFDIEKKTQKYTSRDEKAFISHLTLDSYEPAHASRQIYFNPRIIDNEVCPIYVHDIARLNECDKMFVTRAEQKLILLYKKKKKEKKNKKKRNKK